MALNADADVLEELKHFGIPTPRDRVDLWHATTCKAAAEIDKSGEMLGELQVDKKTCHVYFATHKNIAEDHHTQTDVSCLVLVRVPIDRLHVWRRSDQLDDRRAEFVVQTTTAEKCTFRPDAILEIHTWP
jgi:hypothetical protein